MRLSSPLRNILETAMMKHMQFAAACAALMISACAAEAEETLQHSPITPGYWTWPREKPTTPQAISDECHSKIAFQFADGHYFGLKFRDAEKKPLPIPVVEEIGICQFDQNKQIERCELRINNNDGTARIGAIESTFVVDANHNIKMTVTPKIEDGKPLNATPFDVFPTRCPDAIVWDILNGNRPPR
jgi:hypothetical protein